MSYPKTQILPGVKSIGWIDCTKLQPHVDLHGICETVIPILTAINVVEFFGKAECDCKTEKQSANRVSTASLTFDCPSLLPIHLHLGFVVTDVNGQTWLIGQAEPPYPKIKVTHYVGYPDGEEAGFEYEVTHTSLCSLIECIASY